MKKMLLLLALAFSMATNVCAKRVPMLVQGKTWVYTYHHFEEKEVLTGEGYQVMFDETTWPVQYTLRGDTVIEGRQYMKMYRFDMNNGQERYFGAYREDEEGKVWQWNLQGDNKDFMLCDYTCMGYPGLWEEMGDLVYVIKVNGQLLHHHSWNGMTGVEGVGMKGQGLVHYILGEVPDCICDYESFESVQGGGIYFTANDFNAPKYIELTQDEKQLVEHNNDFAFNLFRTAQDNKSMLLSPLSITYDLGMLNNGAAGQTQQEIYNVLGFSDVNAQNEFCLKIDNELRMAGVIDTSTKMSLSNTIFVNAGISIQLKSDFTHEANQYYHAYPQARDFYNGETRDVINQWASDHTNGMIQEVLNEEEFNPDATSYLLNALYFKGLWSNPFKRDNTKEEPFYGGGTVPMMHKEYTEMQYAENELCQSVCMPYGNGTYQMRVFLPREGKTLADLLEKLNGKNWLLEYRNVEVDLKLPRIETNTNLKLEKIMSALGMPSAFDPNKADFSNFCNSPVFIGMMKQVAKIKLDEEGTEAAAVTVIEMDKTAIIDRAEFHANRPFLYIINEQSTGIILFIGQYVGENTATTIASPRVAEHTASSPLYDLQGRRLTGKPSKGVYIQDGKKRVVK